jgi:hypothetical protein
MLLRAPLLAVCAAAIVFGAIRLHRDDSCQSARGAIVAALFHRQEPAGGLSRQQRRLIDSCRDGTVLAFVSTVETTAGRHAFALQLARKVTRDEPRNRVGWIALSQALARTDPKASAAAVARAMKLDPRGFVPPAAGAGAAPRGA